MPLKLPTINSFITSCSKTNSRKISTNLCWKLFIWWRRLFLSITNFRRWWLQNYLEYWKYLKNPRDHFIWTIIWKSLICTSSSVIRLNSRKGEFSKFLAWSDYSSIVLDLCSHINLSKLVSLHMPWVYYDISKWSSQCSFPR